MAKNGPILLIDDDRDEGELLREVLQHQNIPNPLLCFATGKEALAYLRETEDRPFVILCDVNMPLMNGIEVRRTINEDEDLRKKSIPFVFYTTSATKHAINEAYEMSVQGFFEKGHNVKEIGSLIQAIYTYWHLCSHPNK